MLRIIFLIILGIHAGVCFARMYQWVDPDSGTTQLSGKPPAWYRAIEDGPRVFVFDKGRLIDDTAIEVADIERERLRQHALIRAEQDKEIAKEKLMQAKRQKAIQEQEQAKKIAESEQGPSETKPEEEAGPAEPPPPEKGPDADDLRKLVAEWEKLKKDDIRKLIESADIPQNKDASEAAQNESGTAE